MQHSTKKKKEEKKTVFGRVQFKWKLQYNIDGDESMPLIRRGISHDSVVLNGLTECSCVCVWMIFSFSAHCAFQMCGSRPIKQSLLKTAHAESENNRLNMVRVREREKSNLSKNPADYSFNKKVLLVLNNNQAIWNMYGPWCAYTRFVIAVGSDLFI